jgi:hypothetical protein
VKYVIPTLAVLALAAGCGGGRGATHTVTVVTPVAASTTASTLGARTSSPSWRRCT